MYIGGTMDAGRMALRFNAVCFWLCRSTGCTGCFVSRRSCSRLPVAVRWRQQDKSLKVREASSLVGAAAGVGGDYALAQQ